MHVVVIGSGIVGAGAAYHLSSRGVAVTVIDGAFQGQATYAGAGIVCPWVDHPDDAAWYRLNQAGGCYYPELIEALGEDIGYARVGALLVAEDPADLEPVRALLNRRKPDAPEMGDITDVHTPSALFPPLADDLSAILVPGAARVDGLSVRDALLQAALRHGAGLRTGVATLTPDGHVLLASDVTAASPTGFPQTEPLAGDASWRQAAPAAAGAQPP
ncbi:FAD-dependent oxidoreductase, partial [Nonomuraea sp. NPDC005983]|uniref:NAD(P)/FAD-dependent oxidoreductase n=1 Tax=Nonomuraea sp. NPDC005983 TaxID=3155595 RepID=UPI0033BE29B4